MNLCILLGLATSQLGLSDGPAFVPDLSSLDRPPSDFPEVLNLNGYDLISQKRIDHFIQQIRKDNPTARFRTQWKFSDGDMRLYVSQKWARVVQIKVMRDSDLELKVDYWLRGWGGYFSQNASGIQVSGHGLRSYFYRGIPLYDLCPVPIGSKTKRTNITSIHAEERTPPINNRKEAAEPYLDVFYTIYVGRDERFFRVQFKGRTPIMRSWCDELPAHYGYKMSY